jgi:NADH:ubiquinone reductase (H+-translocating)
MMNTQIPHILVLGGGYAGIQAAVRLSGKARGKAKITLVNAANTFVERIRLHQRAANQTLKQHPISKLLKGTGIDFVQGWVTDLDPDQRKVTINTESGAQTLTYDTLIYALGSFVDRDSVRGVREYAYAITPDDMTELRQKLASSKHLLIVGGGLTGIESATEFAESYPHLKVTLATSDTFGERLSQKGRAHLRKVFARLGITIRDNIGITELTANAAKLANGESLPFDVSLWAGAFAVSGLARDAGLSVNERDQILIDEQMRSLSHPDIYAIGDAAYAPEMPTRMGCVSAMPMASQAANNLAALLNGKEQTPFRFAYVAQCISLGRHEGLLQMVTSDDQPKEQILTGRLAVWIKEMICLGAAWTLYLERTLPGIYMWAQAEKRTSNGNIRELSPDVVRDRL